MMKRITIPLLTFIAGFLLIAQLYTVSVVAQAESDSPCSQLSSPDRIEECYEQEQGQNNDSTVSQSGDVSGTGSTELDEKLNEIINVLSALVGVAIVISIIVGAIQYITAGGNGGQVAAAKQRITMAVLGFFLFLMGYAILQWLVPGGLW